MLSYASTFWSKHISYSLGEDIDEDKDLQEALSHNPYRDMILLLSRIVSNKPLIAMWVEASWTFGISPTILEIPFRISLAVEYVEAKARKELETLAETMKRLSENLSRMNKHSAKVLSETPNEIWLPSINSLADSEFLVGTNDSKVSWLSCPEETESILVVSQVSDDGKEVGVVKVWPSK